MTIPTAPTTMAEAVELGVQSADVDAGITPAPEETGDESGTETDPNAGVGDDATPPGDDPNGAAGGEGGADGDAAAAGDGKAPAADAGGDGEGGEGKVAAKPGEKGAKPGDKPEGEGKPEADPLNDPLPQGLKEATTKRIQDLIKIGKEQTARAEQVSAQFNTIVERVRDTGSTPEQYGQALEYLTMVNSGRREDIIKALEFIDGERVALARMAGVPLPGVSMVADYPDIAAELKAGKITPERAEELAAQRAANEFQANRQKMTDQQTAARNAHTKAARDAQGELNAEEARLLKEDPAYKVKRPLILKLILPQIRSGKLKPNEWLPEFKRLYATVPAPAAKPGPKPGTKVAGRQPLRATQPAGGATPAPKTMAEAVDLGIQMGTRA